LAIITSDKTMQRKLEKLGLQTPLNGRKKLSSDLIYHTMEQCKRIPKMKSKKIALKLENSARRSSNSGFTL